jgi:hypothetical protein
MYIKLSDLINDLILTMDIYCIPCECGKVYIGQMVVPLKPDTNHLLPNNPHFSPEDGGTMFL